MKEAPRNEGIVLVDRGLVLVREGKYAQAIPYFDEALERDGNDARALEGRGRAQHLLQESAAAIEDYTRALAIDPARADVLINRGMLLAAAGDPRAGIADYTEAIRLDPRSVRACEYRAGLLAEQGDAESAVRDLDRVLELDPTEAGVFLRRAELQERLGKAEEALADVDQALRFDPRMVEALKMRSSLLLERGDAERADADLARARQIEIETSGLTSRSAGRNFVASLLQAHFKPDTIESIKTTERTLPFRARVDLQRAIERHFDRNATVAHFSGVVQRYAHVDLSLATMFIPNPHDPAMAAPPQYEEVDIGESGMIRCLKNGLWLLEDGGNRCAVLVAQKRDPCEGARLTIEIAATTTPEGGRLTDSFFRVIEQAVAEMRSYRGKVLSLESRRHYSGAASGITVHRLKPVERSEVILPEKTLGLLDRNVLGFARLRPLFAKSGLSTKKGVLFYGPPGTGKTHTIQYLAGILEGHTTLLITAEQIGLFEEYMTLARLLQPSVVVMEDADLVAKARESIEEIGAQALLNRLLNEMDGLGAEADVLFILTTNRPEELESALASRPGRIDQAIEFPLPDDEGRRKLIRLYARDLVVPGTVVEATVRKTRNVSAAFIKELLRRAAQFHFERATPESGITIEDIDAALEELLFTGGSLNRKLLGAGSDEP